MLNAERVIKPFATRRWPGCSSSAIATYGWFFGSTSHTTSASDRILLSIFAPAKRPLSLRTSLGQKHLKRG